MNYSAKGWRVSVFCILIILLNLWPLHGNENTSDPTFGLSLNDLFNLTVTIASKTAENISDAPGVISVVTQDELKRFGGTTLGDILKRVPSFLGSTVYMTDRSMIASRGDQVMPSSSHVLLLINGRPMREVLEGGIKSEVYESFPVNVIERIEIIRGPGSVLYGSQAFSAVINVITKSADSNTVSVSAALGEGLKNNSAFDARYKIGDVGFVLAGRYADKGKWKTDWQAPGLFGVYTNSVGIPDNGPGAYTEINYKDLRLMCSYNQWQNQSFVPAMQWLRDVPEIGISDVTSRVTWKKLFGDLGYTLKPLAWYNTSANVTYTRSWFEAYDFPMIFRDAYEVLGEWTNFFSPMDHLNITVGGVWGFIAGIERDINNDTLAYNKGVYNKGHTQNNFSGYTQADYHWDWCKVIGGIQANKVNAKDSLGNVDNFKADFNPRAGLIFYPLEFLTIKTLFSTAYRAPSLDELYLDFQTQKGKMVQIDSQYLYPGHTYNLSPEKVNTFDVGVNFQNDKVLFGINGFHSRMQHLIVQRVLSTELLAIWDNIGEVTIFGMECEGKYSVTKNLLCEGSFLFQQSKDENTGIDNVTPLPNFSAKGGLSYRSFGLTASVFNTFQQALDKKYASTMNKTTGYFNMANVHCGYDLNKLLQVTFAKELSLVLNIDNLFDEQIWLPAWGMDLGSTIPYNQGRTIYGGFKVAF